MKTYKYQTGKIITYLEDALKEKMEGGLYSDLNVIKAGRSFLCSRTLYTVKDGIVYMITGENLDPTGDSLIQLDVSCIKIGKYNPGINYKRLHSELSYTEMKKALKLKDIK